jgi:hypothetical protein
MNSRNLARVLLVVSTLGLASAALAQQMSVVNNTTSSTVSTTFEMYPAVTTPLTQTVQPNATASTGLPVNGNTLNSLQFQQGSLSVAGTPVLLTNVLKAALTTNCYNGDSPCLSLTPGSTSNQDAVKQANRFLAQRSPKTEFCMPGIASKRKDTRYFTLSNGLVVQLQGNLAGVPESGDACLCGVAGTPPTPLDTIVFSVRKLCDTGAKAKPGKKNN